MGFMDLTDQTFDRLTAIRRVDGVSNSNLLAVMQLLGYVRIEHEKLTRLPSLPGASCLPRGRGGRLIPLGSENQPLTSDRKKERCFVYWLCLCSCGKVAIVLAEKLRSGHTRSCGCLHSHPGPRVDLTGKTLGDRTVVGWDEGRKRWACKCNRCGKVKYFSTGWLNSERWGSCASCSRVEYGRILQIKRRTETRRFRNLEGLDLRTGLRVSLAAHLALEGIKPYTMRKDIYPDSVDSAGAIKKLFLNHESKLDAEKQRITALPEDQRRLEADDVRTRLNAALAA